MTVTTENSNDRNQTGRVGFCFDSEVNTDSHNTLRPKKT